jgi:uncharacterized protein YciU (UPF0263 family)
MNGEKLIVLPDPPDERPELEFILSGCTTDDERKAIVQAFHTFAQGDPASFSVQFAVLLRAHAAALKLAPERLRKAVGTEFANLADLLLSHKASVKEAGTAITKHAADWQEEVEGLCEYLRKLREQIVELSDSDNRSRESVLTKIVEEREAIHKAAEMILSISERRILQGLTASFAVGVVCYPVLSAIVSWVWRML